MEKKLENIKKNLEIIESSNLPMEKIMELVDETLREIDLMKKEVVDMEKRIEGYERENK